MNTTAARPATMLDRNAATKLAAELVATIRNRRVTAAVEGDRIVFLGAPTGPHTLCFDVSSRERVLAHWDGYCTSIQNGPTGVRSHEELKALYLANAQNGARSTFDGFSTEEISAWSRRLMFGENDEAFPSADEWSRIVD